MVAGVVICRVRAGARACPRSRSCSSARCSSSRGRALGQGRRRARPPRPRRRPPAAPRCPPPPASPRDQVQEALTLDPLELCIGFGLVPLVDGSARRLAAAARPRGAPPDRGGGRHDHPVGPHPRRGRAAEPRVRRQGPRHRGRARARSWPATSSRWTRATRSASSTASRPPSPAYGMAAVWITDAARAEAEALGYTVVDAEAVVVTHLTETIRRHVADLLTRQDVRTLLDSLKEHNAAVVEEVVPDLLSVGELQRVLQALLREGVSIRDLGAIVEAAGDRARVTRDPELLAEYARQALGRTIVVALPRRRAHAARDHARPAPRAGGLGVDRPDARRRVPRDGSRPRAGIGAVAVEPCRAGRRARPAPGADLLLARAAAPAPAVRAGAAPALGVRLQRDRARDQRRDDRSGDAL